MPLLCREQELEYINHVLNESDVILLSGPAGVGKTRLALEKIAALENLQVSEEEIADEYKRLAELYDMEEGKVKEVVDAEAVAEDLKVKKAIELVREKAVVTEVEHDEHTHDAE